MKSLGTLLRYAARSTTWAQHGEGVPSMPRYRSGGINVLSQPVPQPQSSVSEQLASQAAPIS